MCSVRLLVGDDVSMLTEDEFHVELEKAMQT